MPKLPNLPSVILKGSFWSATAEVIQFADPRENWALQTLFLDNTPQTALGTQNLLLPGTLLLLCCMRQVQVKPGNANYTWTRSNTTKAPQNPSLEQMRTALQTGELALLLVQAEPDPAQWRRQNQEVFPELTCLAGDVNLDRLQPPANLQRLYAALKLTPIALGERTGVARLPGAISVHSSGLSIYGQVNLPWQTAAIAAVFQLARLIPNPDNGQPGFRLTIEVDRLMPGEKAALLAAWQQLNRSLNPQNPLNRRATPTAAPIWVTLELANPLRIPRLYWQIAPWQEEPVTLPLLLERDEVNLLLSDQQPYDLQTPPTSLARIVPDRVTITKRVDQMLQVTVESGTRFSQPTLIYEAEPVATSWTESIQLNDLQVAFNPVQVPQLLRRYQNLPAPEWKSGQVIEPAVLWGFMPLEDGWAQLPLPNLTEQIYLDAGLALPMEQQTVSSVFRQGAVSFGNDRPEALTLHPNEQPWNVTLINAQSLYGVWELTPAAAEYQLTSVQLEATQPDLVLNGFFWLSTGKPTPADALPSLDNWLSGLHSFPLTTVSPTRDLFPPGVIFHFDRLVFAVQRDPKRDPYPSAQLQTWSWAYQTDVDRGESSIFRQLTDHNKVLPADCFSRALPLVWQRHRSLPMIQALPLTQNHTESGYRVTL